MTKLEFLDALQNQISHLPQSELEKSLSFYAEGIDDRMEEGMSEAEAVSDLGDIEKIAQAIEQELPITVLVKNKIKTSQEKSRSKPVWMILAICGSPFWLPLGIAFVGVALALYATIWSLMLSLYAVLVSLAVLGTVGLVMGVVHGIVTGPITGVMIIGLSLASAGLFILCLHPINWISQKLLSVTVQISKKIKSVLAFRKEVA